MNESLDYNSGMTVTDNPNAGISANDQFDNVPTVTYSSSMNNDLGDMNANDQFDNAEGMPF